MNRIIRVLTVSVLLLVAAAVYAQDTLHAWIKVPATITANGMVSGSTNLPDGTVLNLHLMGPANSEVNRVSTTFNPIVAVSGGKFGPVAVVPEGVTIPPGNYTLSIIAPGPMASGVQPANVVAITGNNDENLSGPLVKSFPQGTQHPFRDVEASFSVTVQ